jgi:drug/metabolite transporter (DMT)-like permease
MVAIVVAGALLSWDQQVEIGIPWGALAIAGACVCWAIDNNMTRAISASDPVQIAALKGGVAGVINVGIALILGATLPTPLRVLEAGAIGLAGYGVSLVLFVLALRRLGTARTGAYFSTAPFVGASLSLVLLHEAPGVAFGVAGALMAVGVWLHVSERHEHEHYHEPLVHSHRHRHDEHHQHTHDSPWAGAEPHTHEHSHDPLRHMHAHFPDIHHRHKHRRHKSGD